MELSYQQKVPAIQVVAGSSGRFPIMVNYGEQFWLFLYWLT